MAMEQESEDFGTALTRLDLEGWSRRSEDERRSYLEALQVRFRALLVELHGFSDLCVGRFQELSARHQLWRKRVIVGTGAVAIINLLAAYFNEAYGWFSLIAALAAGILAMSANLESFHNSLEHAQAYRESRDLFLDASREFERLWQAHVVPFSDHPEACANATELTRRIVAKDRELRAKFKELTKTDAPRESS